MLKINQCTSKLQFIIGLFVYLFAMAWGVNAKTVNMTIQTASLAAEPDKPILRAWAERVSKQTDGRIKMNIVPANAIVRYDEMFDAVKNGVLQGQMSDPSYWSGIDPAFGLIGNTVGAWSDTIQAVDYIYSGGGLRLMRELVSPYGQHVVGVTCYVIEAFISKKKLVGVSDLKGLKLRAPEGMVHAVFSAAGSAPVNLPLSEVYVALDKGVIDAADASSFATNQYGGFNKIAPYPIYPGFHSAALNAFTVNKKVWDSLPANVQSILESSYKALAYSLRADLNKIDLKALEQAKADPKITVVNWSAEERMKFRRIARKVWSEWANKSPASKKVYHSITTYLKNNNLM